VVTEATTPTTTRTTEKEKTTDILHETNKSKVIGTEEYSAIFSLSAIYLRLVKSNK